MTIPLWYFSIALLIIYTILVIYLFGKVNYILTNNKVGVFNEYSLLWSVLIAIGGPLSFGWFRIIILEMLLEHSTFYINGWTILIKTEHTAQEYYITNFNNIWDYNHGIGRKMLDHWIKLTDLE